MTTATTDTIREFLALPATAMPAANWVDREDDDMGAAWKFLRDSLRPADHQRMNHTGAAIRLTADRDGWRDGVVVTT